MTEMMNEDTLSIKDFNNLISNLVYEKLAQFRQTVDDDASIGDYFEWIDKNIKNYWQQKMAYKIAQEWFNIEE